MFRIRLLVCIFTMYGCLKTAPSRADDIRSVVGPDLVFAENEGLVAVEAEHFHQQTQNDRVLPASVQSAEVFVLRALGAELRGMLGVGRA